MPGIHRKIPVLIPQEVRRFWSKIDKTPGQGPKGQCWLWKGGSHTKSGYGIFTIYRCGKRIALLAHRVAYLLTTGNDPSMMLVCHHCDNPPCCNTEDFFLGTTADNFADMRNKGRGATSEKLSQALKKKVATGWKPNVPAEKIRRGEAHRYARLTEKAVLEIRVEYAEGQSTLKTRPA